MGIKLKLETESLLQWAYRDELPKGADGASFGDISPMFRLADLGTRVDDFSREPGFPRALGEAPHPDALQIEAVVKRLTDLQLTPATWRDLRGDLMGHLAPYAPEDDVRLVRMHFETRTLVMLHARMGTRPIWDLGATKLVRVQEKNGKPRVQYVDDNGDLVNGLTPGNRYGSMARCPVQLAFASLPWTRERRRAEKLTFDAADPTGIEIAAARGEYLAWRFGLQQVTERLESWGMTEHEVLPPRAAVLPWATDTEQHSRILHAPGVQQPLSKLPLSPQRAKALPPLQADAKRFHPVTHIPPPTKT